MELFTAKIAPSLHKTENTVPDSADTKTLTTPPRILGLDGLRAIAMIFVVFYHVFPQKVSAGFIGVDVFFVISGFLITALLLREKCVKGKVDIFPFWMRRIRRIMPVVILTTLTAGALAVLISIFGPLSSKDATTGLRWQIFGALTGTYNWFEIAHSSSYFDSANPLLLTNLWSLAVELQFYIIWPLVLMLLTRITASTKIHLTFTLAAAASAAIWHQILLVQDSANATRAYVGTDAHIFGMMIGASLALAIPNIMTHPQKPAARYWGWISFSALISLTILAILAQDSAWFYPWGMVLAAIFSALTIRGILPDNQHGPGALLGKTLETKPCKWLGVRSYGIYLWHWPLWVIGYYIFEIDRTFLALVVILFSVFFAHLSYKYVEEPIRRGTFTPWMKNIFGKRTKVTAAVSAFSFAAAALTAYGIFTSSDLTSAQQIVTAGEKICRRKHSRKHQRKTKQIKTKQIRAEPLRKQNPRKHKNILNRKNLNQQHRQSASLELSRK
ncbi:acyltransferase [Arcanobacterium hippocoleae]